MSEEIIYGINPVTEALRGKRRVFELFVARDGGKRLEEILRLAQEKGIPVRQREKRDLERLTGSDHHQGAALRAEGFSYANLHDILEKRREREGAGLVLVLDGIQDPHNLGGLIRSAACAGADGVVIPRDRAAGVTPAAEKASAGSAGTVPVARVANIVQALEELKAAGFWIYGAAGEAAEPLYGQDLSGNVALVIGSEGEGLRRLVRASCDVLVSIPMQGGTGSLNASVAGGIMLFEALRQRLVKEGKPGNTP